MARTHLTRRTVLTWGLGGAGAVVAAGLQATSASGQSSATLWRLDPDWGTPIQTSSGAFKTRCRGSACHNAAPNRYFLTRADALAGRLHPCCLAQPVAVTAAVDLNTLAPYYAHSGGIDVRNSAVPSGIRTTLEAATVVPAVRPEPTTSSTEAPTKVAMSEDGGRGSAIPTPASGSDDGVSGESDARDVRNVGSASPERLAFTGAAAAPLAAVAAGAIAVGTAGVVVARRRSVAASTGDAGSPDTPEA